MAANHIMTDNKHNVTTDPSQSGRIAYIDLAKGLCIIFVIFGHINYLLYPELLKSPFANVTSSFRIPLYFFLGGLFFKTYGGFLDFTLRKTNNLLVPFVFWHLTMSLGLAWVIGIVTTGSWSLEPVKENFLAILHDGNPLNIPLWFLLALFVTNLLFYCLFALVKRLKHIHLAVTLTVGAILFGVVGQLLRTFEIHLPLYLDTACTAMPFFAAGYLIQKYTGLLSSPMNWKGGAVIVFGLIMMSIAFIMNVYFIDLRLNALFVPTPLAYLFGFAGIAMILYVSKAIGHIPVISYIGRYSIVLLVLHTPFIHIFGGTICKLCGEMPDIGKCMITLVVITSLCIACIPLCRRFLPKFTAQKGLIKSQ